MVFGMIFLYNNYKAMTMMMMARSCRFSQKTFKKFDKAMFFELFGFIYDLFNETVTNRSLSD
jgi:hypothetical protein